MILFISVASTIIYLLIISKSKSFPDLFLELLKRFFFSSCLLDVFTWMPYSFLKCILSENWPQYSSSPNLTFPTTQSPKLEIFVSYASFIFFILKSNWSTIPISSTEVYFKSVPFIEFPLLLKYRLSNPFAWNIEISIPSHVFKSNLPYAAKPPQTHAHACTCTRRYTHTHTYIHTHPSELFP